MTTKKFDWIETLEENPTDVYLDSTSILLKLMDNVIRNPSDPKYRSIRIANPTVSKKLMSAIGAMECLFEIGFEEDEDKLTLPENISLDYLRQVREEITSRRKSYLKSNLGHNQVLSPSLSCSASSGTLPDRTEVREQESAQCVKNVQTTNLSTASNPPCQSVNVNNLTPVVSHGANKLNSNSLNQPQNVKNNQRSFRDSPGSSGESSGRRMPADSSSGTMVLNPSSQFIQSIYNHSYAVLQYEDKELQNKALKLIPVQVLEAAAERKMFNIRLSLKKSPDKEQEIDVKELVLMELLDWFKKSFFTWVDAPQCNFCSAETTFTGLSSNPAELRETKRVEVYVCKVCNQRTLFPRHHDVTKLLETRKGRCGEWASCFTLFCRSMGWDTRHIVDQTDHVWTEVYSPTQGRWLHCDPCENVCDQPLLYEKGWGKKLSYVIGYSCDEIQDVTWRYTADHCGILERRTLCSEDELLKTLWHIRHDRQRGLSVPRRTYLLRRLLSELVEFMVPPETSRSEFQGRTSGSLAWRMARGETGGPDMTAAFVWEPNSAEKSSCCMQILYSAAQDKYIRGTSNDELKSWQNGVFETNCIFRKEEADWKKAYLARTEGSSKGSIVWKIDCSTSGLIVDSVSIKCVGTTFETGKITLTLCNEDFCIHIPSGNSAFETNALSGSQHFTLNAELSGGKGNVAWQHAQLFRQNLDNRVEFPLSIVVKLKKVSP